MVKHADLTKGQQAFFLDFMADVQKLTAKHPAITNMEFISIMARCIGMTLAACAPRERAMMRQLAIENIDTGFANYNAAQDEINQREPGKMN